MLKLAIGTASEAGKKPRNEDAFVAVEPPAGADQVKGWLVALADGISHSADGKLAAQATVRGLAADYYATPDTWETAHAIDRIVTAQNAWLNGQAGQGEPLATTLTALIFRSRHFTLAHVGDTRAYQMRGERFEQLSEDHVWQQPGFSHVLKRAVGLDKHVIVDFRDGELAENDVFALLCDGVWEALGDVEVNRLLRLHDDVQRAAEALVAAALAAGSNDNVSAVVVRVVSLPHGGLIDELAQTQSLTVPHRLKPGQTVAGFTIDQILAETRASIIYRASDALGLRVVIKTLSKLAASDEELVQGLLTEGWLMKRVGGHYLPELIEPTDRQWLMLVMRWYPGQTLADKLKHGERLNSVEIVRIALRLSRALSALHRLDIIHRDIKPENLHIDVEGRVRLLDLGVAHCPGISRETGNTPGTPSYLAPEQFTGSPASLQTDLYAAGVTLYYALTRRYPYGEIEPFQTPNFTDPIPPGRYRPDTPVWLESVLLKLLARDPAQRFETAEELRLALELGDAKPLSVSRRSPLAQRSPGQLWMVAALISVAFNFLLLFVLLVSEGAPTNAGLTRNGSKARNAVQPVPSTPLISPIKTEQIP